MLKQQKCSEPLINITGNSISDIGSNQLTSFYSKIIRKPINSSRKKISHYILAMIMKQGLDIIVISHDLRICLVKTT